MSTQTLPLVDPQRTDSSRMNHLYCCDPDRALCGYDLTDGEFVPEDEPTECVVCDDLDASDVSCGARFCRLRSWWRVRRPS